MAVPMPVRCRFAHLATPTLTAIRTRCGTFASILATASQGHPDLRLCGWQMFEDDTDVDGYRYGSEVFSFGSGVRHRLGHGSEEATPIPSSCLPACTGPLPP